MSSDPSSASSTSVVAAAAPSSSFPFECSSLPTGRFLHTIYLRGLTAEQLTAIKNASAINATDFSVLRGEYIVDLFQLQCAATKASLHALRNKLKTKNIHSEFAFSLGYSNHFQTSTDYMNAKVTPNADAKYNVVVSVLHASETKLATLSTLLNPLASLISPFSSLRSHCDVPSLVKHYKITDSELLPFPSATAAAAAQPGTTLDPLVQAVINRIAVKV